MNWSLWLGFVAASLLMGLIPGPGVMSIVGYAVGSGRRTALASVAGMAVGNITAMTLSLAGVGALLAASALAFAVLKWAGALYLVGLGVATLLKRKPALGVDGRALRPISPRTAFVSNIAIGVFHPKTIVFFVSFVPQFITVRDNYPLQAAVLIGTFGLVVGCTDTAYALAAARASRLLRGPRTALWSKRAGGGVLIAAGVATAAARS